MLYVDEVVLHNFRSFRQGAIKFSRGFNCVVGPNGSGKSSIASAIMFALGESSLRRLDVPSAQDLINYGARPVPEEKFKRAVVKVKFSGDSELEVSRTIRSDKKLAYRLDGKRVAKQEMIEVLRAMHADINRTNTITQSETEVVTRLKDKERRVLIEVAAGISEYDEKIRAAQQDLVKVEENIRVARSTLHDRLGWLETLEKDKVAAEQYSDLKGKIARGSFTMLKHREREATERLEAAIKATGEKAESLRELDKKVAELSSDIEATERERSRLAGTMGSKSSEMASATATLEELKKTIAIYETQLSALEEATESSRKRKASYESELDRTQKRRKEVQDSIAKLEFERKLKEKALPKAGPGTRSLQDDSKDVAERYAKCNEELEKLQQQLLAASSENGLAKAEYARISSQISDEHRHVNELGADRASMQSIAKSHKDAMANAEASLKELGKAMAALGEELSKLEKDIGRYDSEWLSLQDSLSRAGKDQNRVGELLARQIKSGIYGRADELCTYEDKNALAVQAAAGGRLGYFIVESLEVAEQAVGVLKAQKAGRASFIPLDSIKPRAAKQPAGLRPVLELVKFDKRFRTAFEFIFSNTYMVGSIADARRSGLGEYRLVTLEGDLVEQSGLVTGGSMKVLQGAKALEAKLRAVEQDRDSARRRMKECEARAEELRKKMGEYETSRLSHEMELKHVLKQEDDTSRQLEQLASSLAAMEARKAEADKVVERTGLDMERFDRSIKDLKSESAVLYSRLQAMAMGGAESAKTKEEAQREEVLRKELEEIKVTVSGLSASSQAMVEKEQELARQIAAEKDAIGVAGEKAAMLMKEKADLSKKRLEVEDLIRAQGKKHQALLEQIQGLESRAKKQDEERGRLRYLVDRLKDEAREVENTKSSLQTRLNDIKAELLSYPSVEPLQDTKPEELDRQIAVWKSDLEKLGDVNLKAPEYYKAKKAEADEAQAKLGTLQSEKDSITVMIEEISKKKVGVFMDTLSSVNESFSQLFSHVFDGHASLKLKVPSDPFNSGLAIETTSKEFKPATASGGQKALLAIMVLLAIQIRKPMSFYILDEIDHSLDADNAKKLSRLIKELSKNSQFIVISHNNSLVTEADAVVGVARTASEGSKVYGVEIKSNLHA